MTSAAVYCRYKQPRKRLLASEYLRQSRGQGYFDILIKGRERTVAVWLREFVVENKALRNEHRLFRLRVTKAIRQVSFKTLDIIQG